MKRKLHDTKGHYNSDHIFHPLKTLNGEQNQPFGTKLSG